MSLLGTLKVFVVYLSLLSISTNGDTGNLPVDMQSLSTDNERQMAMYPNTIYYPSTYSMYPQERNVQRMATEQGKSAYDFISNLDVPEEENSRSRAATKFAPTYAKPLKYAFDKPTFWPAPVSAGYQEPLLTPIQGDLLKPKLEWLESKTSNKLGSLLNLGFALLGGSGFKETLINNILRPILSAKSGLKSLIAKLSIPVVALLLVNVEILFVVWWLWEECPEAGTMPIENMTPFSSQTPVSNFSNNIQKSIGTPVQ